MKIKKMSLNESVQIFVEDWMKKEKLEEELKQKSSERDEKKK